MTTPDKILLDLLPGRATTDAIAEHVCVPMLAVRAMLCRLEIDGLVEPSEIGPKLAVWELTENGREVALSLKTDPS